MPEEYINKSDTTRPEPSRPKPDIKPPSQKPERSGIDVNFIHDEHMDNIIKEGMKQWANSQVLISKELLNKMINGLVGFKVALAPEFQQIIHDIIEEATEVLNVDYTITQHDTYEEMEAHCEERNNENNN